MRPALLLLRVLVLAVDGDLVVGARALAFAVRREYPELYN